MNLAIDENTMQYCYFTLRPLNHRMLNRSIIIILILVWVLHCWS